MIKISLSLNLDCFCFCKANSSCILYSFDYFSKEYNDVVLTERQDLNDVCLFLCKTESREIGFCFQKGKLKMEDRHRHCEKLNRRNQSSETSEAIKWCNFRLYVPLASIQTSFQCCYEVLVAIAMKFLWDWCISSEEKRIFHLF